MKSFKANTKWISEIKYFVVTLV